MQRHLQHRNCETEQAILHYSSPLRRRRFMHTCIIRIDGSREKHGDATCCRCHGRIEGLMDEDLNVADDVAGPAVGEVIGGPGDGVYGDEEEGYDVYDYERTCGDIADAVEETEWDDEKENENYREDWERDGVGRDGIDCSWRIWTRSDDIA
ncbi:hypothetical protein EYC80_005647 [Monilinia laxa]|uniref:Uncharacterized protein n=1 Tax=Monilinia laxa TaxID=61186 RepID=A0A5N6KEU3_MONLA|nr:hypothetical protein EYC80_005647 [Monilinia laxa]